MNSSEKQTSPSASLGTLSGTILLWWWLLFSLASIGHFSKSFVIVAGLVALGVGGSGFYQASRSNTTPHEARPSRSIKILLLTGGFFLSLFLFLTIALSPLLISPTIFSGRDQGSYSLAAIQLAQTGHLTFDSPSIQAFFHLYGPGKALNFPGFAYTASGALVPQFPLGSIVWYAGFVALFGLAGFFVANVVSALLSSVFFFALLRFFLPLGFSLFGTSLFAISFPLIWFGRFTLSENLALPLFLLLCFHAIHFLAQPSRLALFLSLAAALALAITRIEGWAILTILFLLFGLTRNTRQWLTKHFSRTASLLILAGALLIVFWDGFVNLAFFRSLASLFWHKWFATATLGENELFFSSLSRLWQILWLYALAPVFLIGLFSALMIARRRQWIALIPLLLAAPTLLYLFNANISADHPWMLRRFAFTLWPTFLFLTLLGIQLLHDFLPKRFPRQPFARFFAPILCTILFLSSTLITLRFLPIVENPLLLRDTATFSQRFSSRDLVLIDRLASGDPFALLAGPLQAVFHRQAVYFFNPNDLTRLDAPAFEHIYLLVDSSQAAQSLEIFGNSLFPVDAFSFRTSGLDTTRPVSTEFPSSRSLETRSLLFEYRPR